MADQSSKSSDKARRRKTLIYTAVGAGVIVVGGAAYLWFTRTPNAPEQAADPGQASILPSYVPEPIPPVHNLPAAPSGFPLKKGSKGPLVTALQNMLNTRFKSGLEPDGDWGRKTDSALVKAGLPTQIDAATYAALIGPAKQSQPTASQPTASEVVANWSGTPLELATKAANGIAYWVNARNPASIMTFLKAMRNVSDYSAVNTVFRMLQTANEGGVKARRTLVNALLGDDMGWNGTANGQFTHELLRMGLKHNPATDKWTLSGLGGGFSNVRVTTPTTIWNPAGLQSQVPAGLRLGMAVASGNGITQVYTPSGETVFVPSHALSQVIL